MRSAALHPLVLAISTALLSPAFAVLAQNNDIQQADEQKIEKIVVTGTRVAGRSVDDTAVPIDIIGVAALERSPCYFAWSGS
jgi:iron complex outermembrane receptor protein